ncbi:MAG: hypothetical protein EXQ86_08790 [Rhodospirillales bacterium]|nr:hypothetical protein [Rhodospirillales bacterium]
MAQSLTCIEVDGDGVARRGPLPTRLRWRDMRRMTLRHYSVTRDRSAGWLELRVSDGRSAPWHGMRVDSGLVGFQAIAAQAASAATSNGVRLDRPSTANLAALGISVASSAPSPVGDRPLLGRHSQ